MTTNDGRWANWYHGLTADDPQPYGNSDSYRILAEWVSRCDKVEDWGCGKGWMRTFVPDTIRNYRGVDGTSSPFADVVADLASYTSDDADGIVIRHVLEHDWRWSSILANALMSVRDRLGLCLFTPLAAETGLLSDSGIPGVPNLQFAEDDIAWLIDCYGEFVWSRVDVDPSPTEFGVEHIYLVERSS